MPKKNSQVLRLTKGIVFPILLIFFLLLFSGCSSVPDVSNPNSPIRINKLYKHNQKVAAVLNQLHRTRGAEIKGLLQQVGLTFPLTEIKLIGIKDIQQLEVWGRNKTSLQWKHIKTYPFTGFSGKLGPKLREGDKQIPEGIYRIPSLNPQSSYHLSLFIDYPNQFDLKHALREGRTNVGGEIFIHGSDKTIGCIPIGDFSVEELFYLVGWTKETNASVIIAPYDLRVLPIVNHTSLYWVSLLYADIKRALQPFHHQ
jgi:hypothetical protein